MLRFTLAGMFKFLIGILLVQAATGLLVIVALGTENRELWLLLGALGLTFGLLAAFWFSTIVAHTAKDATAHVREGFSREREKIRVRAEREKSKVMQESQKRIIKDRSRSQTKANTKTGVLFTGMLALGGIMVFTQFFTFGLLLMGTAGGALGGYLMRSKRPLFGRKDQSPAPPPLATKKNEKLIGERIVDLERKETP